MPDVIADLTLITGTEFAARVSMRQAIDQIQATLRGGFDPETDLARTIADVPHGQLLLMPSAAGGAVGQKLGLVAPQNPSRGLERIQALYILLDGDTLTPTTLIDGTALTSLRTPAVSAAVADLLATPDAADVTLFGTGPQAVRHVEALAAIRPLASVRFIGRDPDRTRAAIDAARSYVPDATITAGTPDDVQNASLIVCATTASTPLFADNVRDDATIIAIGSHEPDRTELDPHLVGRAQVVVESRRVALSEAGDVVTAVAAGTLDADTLVTMHDLFTARTAPATDRPRIIKTCGMGWQDLIVAQLAA